MIAKPTVVRDGRRCKMQTGCFPTLADLNRFKPKLCRAMAMHRGRLKTQAELVAQSGMSKEKIIRITRMDGWEQVKIGDAVRFLNACGFRLNRLRSDFYRRMSRMKSALRKMNANQRRFYARLLPDRHH